MTDIGIIIVTYNSAAEIGACLDAALATGAEIVVVDNASDDGTIAEVARRGVRLIANPEIAASRPLSIKGSRIEESFCSAVESRCGDPQ